MLPSPEISGLTIEDYLKILKKRWALISSFLVIIPLSVAIFVFTAKPVYRAYTSLLIEQQLSKVTKFEATAPIEHHAEYNVTQHDILCSRALAESVFNELQLGNIPEYVKERDPIKALQDRISIKPLVKSQIVLVYAEDVDPVRASNIANTIARLYIKQDVENRRKASQEEAEWLRIQLAEIERKVQNSEIAINNYIQQNKITTIRDVDQNTELFLDRLKTGKSKIDGDIAAASKRYREKHPKMISLREQLKDINEKIDVETSRLLKFETTEYRALKTELKSNQNLYESILASAKEKGVSGELNVKNSRIIDPAIPPQIPHRPKKALSIVISIFFSLICGAVCAFFVECMDSTVRTAEDVRLYVKLPFLGYIPAIGKNVKKNEYVLCHEAPESRSAESYRTLLASILFASPEDNPFKAILITSALPNEGKSYVAANLAIIFSQKNERVILLDFNMRRPVLHKAFNVSQDAGLSSYLTGKVNLTAVIKPTSIENLSLISCEAFLSNPRELFALESMRLLFKGLASRFDRIVVDSSALLACSDAALLANIVDGVILVAKSGSTHLQEINEAKENISAAKGNIIGVVINDIDIEKSDRHYYHYHYGDGSRVHARKS